MSIRKSKYSLQLPSYARWLIFPLYFLNELVKLLVKYNIWIALGAVALTQVTYLLCSYSTDIYLLSFIFLATLFIYTIDIPFRFSFRFAYLLKIFNSILLVIFFLCLSNKVLLSLSPVAFIAFFYHLPSNYGILSVISLRKIPFIKIFLISYCWAFVTVLLPLIDLQPTIWHREVWLLFLQRFIFILAITLPFDIGDYHEDKAGKIMTIPLFIGVFSSKILAYGLVIGFIIAGYFQFPLWQISITHLFLGLVCILLIYLSTPDTPKMYYKKYLDGTMLFYWVLLLCILQLF